MLAKSYSSLISNALSTLDVSPLIVMYLHKQPLQLGKLGVFQLAPLANKGLFFE
jgi:hypothetical protein